MLWTTSAMEMDATTRSERAAATVAASGHAAVAAALTIVAEAWTMDGRATVKQDAAWGAEWKLRR